jgi:hypothetical protein
MRTKLILAGLTAALVMAFAANSASARNLSISHGELWLVTWTQLQFRSALGTAVECDVTLDGSFHYRTFIKLRDTLVGYITRAIAGHCLTGSATILTTNLPWHIRYQSFEGTLPNILGVRLRLILAEFRLRTSIGECLARTTATEPAEGVVRLANGLERRLVTGLTADGNARILCRPLEISGNFAGTGVVRELPGLNTNLLVRLI